jgi:hypothetical protein
MLMQATWEGVIIALLLLPPGTLYYSVRARTLKGRVLKSAEMESSSTDTGKDWLVLPRVMFLSICLELLAATIVVVVFWFLLWVADQQNWLASQRFDTSPPNPQRLLDESWDNARGYASDYRESHWLLLSIAAVVAYSLALVLGWRMGRRGAKRTIYQEAILREAYEISSARSHVMIRLKNGTVYSGNLSGGPRRQPILGKEELVLIAPIKVRIKGIDMNLSSESVAVATSEIASLSLVHGKQKRLFLYSDAPPPWLPS